MSTTWTRRSGLSAEHTELGRVQRLLIELLRGPKHDGAGALPTSIRFLFYELVQAGHIQKKHIDIVSEALMPLRRAEIIPWAWIADETRRLNTWARYDTIQAGVLDGLDAIRLDHWAGAAPPMILTESRSLAGVLERISAQYLAPIAATNGQVGGFLYTDLIPALREGQHVLYFGDLDLVGGDIEANTRRTIEGKVGELAWERIALTPEQVAEYQVPSRLKSDRRFRRHPELGQHEAYETEALSQTVIQRLLTDRLEELLPAPLDATLHRARTEREALRHVIGSASS